MLSVGSEDDIPWAPEQHRMIDAMVADGASWTNATYWLDFVGFRSTDEATAFGRQEVEREREELLRQIMDVQPELSMSCDEEQIEQMLQMGFSREQSVKALAMAGSVEEAIALVLVQENSP